MTLRFSAVFSILIFSSAWWIPSKGIASVNMRNGSYTEKWVDIIVPGDGYDLNLERYYSSRSLYIGIFGFGWCSKFETKLEVSSSGEIIVSDCGGGLEATYYPQGFDPISAAQTTDSILRSIKTGARKVSNASDKTLKDRLLTDPFERFNLARRYQIVDGKTFLNRKAIFVSKRSKLDKIEFTGKYYIHRQKNGEIAKFDSRGRLIQLVDRQGHKVQIQYRGGRISFISDGKGRQLLFTYNKGGNVEKITNGSGLSVAYSFEGEDLTEVTNAWRNTYFFEYDRAHNLTKVSFPGGTSISMTYDTKRDWITKYNDRILCRDDYDYTSSPEAPKDHYWSVYKRKCPKKVNGGKYEFWYKTHNSGNGKYLERIQALVDRDRLDSLLHPYLGEPLKITSNNFVETFSYLDLGLKSRSDSKSYDSKKRLVQKETTKYTYNKSYRQVTQVNRTRTQTGSKKSNLFQTSFKYARNGLLKSAKTKGGETISVAWSNSGKILELNSPKGTKLTLRYSPDFPKPKVIDSKYGAVEINYTPTGEVLSVTSKKGNAIAAKVVQAFVGYIDVISPAVDDLKI